MVSLTIILAAAMQAEYKGNHMNIIALDISKDSADCFLKTKQHTAELKISNNLSGSLKLLYWIKQHKIRQCMIVMEATGVYYETLANHLSQYHQVSVINPLKIKDYGKSLFNRTKTDKADARLIAEYAYRHHDKLNLHHAPSNQQYRLTKLIALSAQLKRQITQQRNRLHASNDNFVNYIHQTILITLIEQQTFTHNEIQSLIEQCNTFKQHYQNLLTIPAIAEKSAPIILTYLNSKDFGNSNQFIAFAGLCPKIEQSGSSVDRKGNMIKLGHKRLKAAFFQPALVAYNRGYFPQLVKNLEAAKKPKMVIIGAIMRKLAKICYAIYKSGKPFDKSRYALT